MSNYYLDSERHHITFGYDQCLKSFWLVIYRDHTAGIILDKAENNYIFNNLEDWPGGLMTINDVRYVLEKFSERIPQHDLYQLYLEAEHCGYFASLSVEDFRYPMRNASPLCCLNPGLASLWQKWRDGFYNYFKPKSTRKALNMYK